MTTVAKVRQAYLDFMQEQGHAVVPSASLVPENDPTTLFTGSGMQPMVQYLLGEPHPSGIRIADSQKCFRAEDIEEVGDNRHTTFFEMLGNWSLGDYWKQEQLTWIFTFLVEVVGLDPNKLYVTVFAGDAESGIDKDDTAVKIWQHLFDAHEIAAKPIVMGSEAAAAEIGMQNGRIFYYEAKKNWWSRAGIPSNMPSGELGGPDSEIFYEFTQVQHDPAFGKHCHPNCDCGRFLEIGNSVFMAYQKQEDESFAELPNKNIDFGGGLERIVAAAMDEPDIFKIDVFAPIIAQLESLASASYDEAAEQQAMRIIADHLRAAVFIIADEVKPANKQQGYFLRRLLRRAVMQMEKLGIEPYQLETFVAMISQSYLQTYPQIASKSADIITIIHDEETKFRKTLRNGRKKLRKSMKALATEDITAEKTGEILFDFYQSHGLPLEISLDLFEEATEAPVDRQAVADAFADYKQQHAEKSRSASAGMFTGGLEEHSATTIKYHTATHLLHQALRDVLGDHVQQMGSNITVERLRFDFKHPSKLTEEEKADVELMINQQIEADLPVTKKIQDKDTALAEGALAFFREKYPDKVSVYTIGNDPTSEWYSKELCGGPHVSSTGEIGAVRIIKEKAVGAGVRRVYITLAAK